MAEKLIGSTVPRRQLGRELRRLREQDAGIAQIDAARALEWSVTKLWRLERGELAVRTPDVKAMCELYGADEQTTAALTAIAPHTRSSGWWHDFAEIPFWFRIYAGFEEAACRLRMYHDALIPGTFQTREYATAVFAADTDGVPRDEIEKRLAIRMARARLLTRLDPRAPEFDVVLDESVLRRPVGGAGVMAGQLRRVAEAGELPNVSVRIVPFQAGLHGGVMAASPFTVLEFPQRREPSIVHIEGFTGALFLDKPAESERYAWAFEHLRSAALDEAASRDLILHAAREYES